MSNDQKWNALYTLVRKEVTRVLRIWTQTLLPPAVTMGIYFVVFGSFLGSRIQDINGVHYIEFIAPGLIIMTAITNSFSNVASSFFTAKFQRNIEELLVSPMPDWLVVVGYASGGLVRGLLSSLIVTAIALSFTRLSLAHPVVALAYLLMTTSMFSLAGLTNAVFARKFDDITIIPTFVLTPMTYFAGVFYSISLLPPIWRSLSLVNPVFYMVNGFRYGVLGISDAGVVQGLVLLGVANLALLGLNLRLLARGTGLTT